MKQILMKAAMTSGLLAVSLACMADAMLPTMTDTDFYVRVTEKADNKNLVEFEVCLPTDKMMAAVCNSEGAEISDADESPYCEPIISHERKFYDKYKLKGIAGEMKSLARGKMGLMAILLPVVGGFLDAPKNHILSLASEVLSDAFLNDKEVLVYDNSRYFSASQMDSLKKQGNIFTSMEQFGDALKLALDKYNQKYPTVHPSEQ